MEVEMEPVEMELRWMRNEPIRTLGGKNFANK